MKMTTTTPHRILKPKCRLLAIIGILTASVMANATTHANDSRVDQSASSDTRCVILEIFVDSTREFDQKIEEAVRTFTQKRGGILLAVRDLSTGKAGKERLAQIASHFKIEPGDRPLLYCLNRVIHNRESVEDYQKSLEQSLQIEVFVRPGCSRCTAAKTFLLDHTSRYPALSLVYYDISSDKVALQKLNGLVAKHQQAASSVPVIHICESLTVGFISEQASGKRFDSLLLRWTKECPPLRKENREPGSKPSANLMRVKSNALRIAIAPINTMIVAASGVAATHPF